MSQLDICEINSIENFTTVYLEAIDKNQDLYAPVQEQLGLSADTHAVYFFKDMQYILDELADNPFYPVNHDDVDTLVIDIAYCSVFEAECGDEEYQESLSKWIESTIYIIFEIVEFTIF